MQPPFQARSLTKRFGDRTALDAIDLDLRPRSMIGLLGRNGSGKTTLMRHILGLYLPSSGSATTLGRPAHRLRHRELVEVGFVPQEIRLLDWMTVEQQLSYVSRFYPRWDRQRERRLRQRLELSPDAQIGGLSTGDLQKLAVILSVCHHPSVLLLDEPVSDLDPIVRARLLEFLLELLEEDRATVLVSSHVLRDVEKIVDWVLCLDQGRLVADAELDDLKERYAEWIVRSPQAELPERFGETFVLEQEVTGGQARLRVDRSRGRLEEFRTAHRVEVESRPLGLEEIFPLLIERPAA